MSDLYIEARLQAIKDIASTSCSDIKDADNIASFCDEIYSAIPNLDKIIEELELHSFELGTDTLPVHYVRLNEAIEIVKQGGVETETETIRDKAVKWNNNSSKRVPYEFIDYVEGRRGINISDDVCEWKLDDDNLITSCGEYFNLFDNCTEKFKYCPRCGKKIKVVEQMDEEEFCYCHYRDNTYEYFDCLDYMECEECPYYYADEDQKDMMIQIAKCVVSEEIKE